MDCHFSRQDIYDHCRSIFIKYHVNLVTPTYPVGSEIMFTLLQGYFESDIPRTLPLEVWANIEDDTFSRVYQLGLYHVVSVHETDTEITYTALPATEITCCFKGADYHDHSLTGKQKKGENTIHWSYTDQPQNVVYCLPATINYLNETRHPKNRELVAYMTEELKGILSPTVNSLPPTRHFWREAVRYQLFRQAKRCVLFYGIPLVPFLSVASSWAWLVILLLFIDCYLSYRNSRVFARKDALSLYRITQHWKQVDQRLREGKANPAQWCQQSSRLLADIRSLPESYLEKRRQAVYLDELNVWLTTVKDAALLTPDQCIALSDKLHQLLTGYCTRSYY